MRFDPEALQALLALDDSALWAKIRSVAGASGIRLTENVPSPADMARIRAAFGGYGQADVAAALDTIARFRQGK